MGRHLSDEELLRLRLTAGDEPSSNRAQEHLDTGCSLCRRRMKQIEAVLAALSAPALPEVPEEWIGRAAQWIAGREEARARKAPSVSPTLKERIRAALSLDSLAGAVPAGVRAAGPAGERQLVFESEAGQVVVAIAPGGPSRGLSIRGQFLPAEDVASIEGASARLKEPARARERVERLSPAGEFRFTGVKATEMLLAIEWRGHRIELDSVALGESGGV